DHGRGRVLLHEDHPDPARGLDLVADRAAALRVLDVVGGVMGGVHVAGLDAGVAAFAEVDDVALGEADLGGAALGSQDVEAVVLGVVEDVLGALQGHLFDGGYELLAGARPRDDLSGNTGLAGGLLGPGRHATGL